MNLPDIQVDGARADWLGAKIEQAEVIHVIGLGNFGGNRSLIAHLCREGKSVELWESSPKERLEESWSQLENFHSSMTVHWSSSPNWEEAPELTFVTPAVPPQKLKSWGLDANNTSTEIELALVLAHAKGMKIHAVTGSVGKSTTVKLISEALGVPAVGNIGQSLFENEGGQWPVEAVMELSSFQLHHLQSLKFVPSSFVLTPVHDHHAAWHGSVEAYQNCKREAVAAWKAKVSGVEPETDLTQARNVFGEGSVSLLGDHNRTNILRVVQLLVEHGCWDQEKGDRLAMCKALPHRLEVVMSRKGRIWVNDSKATSPSATIKALEAVRPGVMILDGLWSADPSSMLQGFHSFEGLVILMGGAHALEGHCLEERFRLAMATTLTEALELALGEDGDVLYSPGAPSYDRFKNYEERGDTFKSKLESLLP